MSQTQFLNVVDREEADRRFRAALGTIEPRIESVRLESANGRVLAEDVVAGVDVPAFDRSDVDGYAVRAADAYGCSELKPVSLTLLAADSRPGRMPTSEVGPNTAMRISTGAMMPRGADAVVMVEDTDEQPDVLRIRHSVVPGENVTFAGSDVSRGEIVARSGQTVTARECGVLAAIGVERVRVFRRPIVAILSTGDELAAPGEPISVGRIYDSNSAMLAALTIEFGGEPRRLGIVPDSEAALETALSDAMDSDVVVVSGGTSKGQGDLTHRAVGRLGSPGIVVHGVALKPGKPLCLAVIERVDSVGLRRVPIAVLPGFPASAMFTFRDFIGPVIASMTGKGNSPPRMVSARLQSRVNSAKGRTEYVLSSLISSPDGVKAYVVGRGSGSISAFAAADGYITIDRDVEFIDAGDAVDVRLLAEDLRLADLNVVGSHCLGLDWILCGISRRGFAVKMLTVGSQGGVRAVAAGDADLAGIHLLDVDSGEYNSPFVPPNAALIRGYQRMQGIVYRQDDVRLAGKDLEEFLREIDLPGLRMVNRNRGSGTRIVIERLLSGRRPDGYEVDASTHHAVAAAIAQRRADWGVAIEPAARFANLGFLPVRTEQFDFIVQKSRLTKPAVVAFVEAINSATFAAKLDEWGFQRVPG